MRQRQKHKIITWSLRKTLVCLFLMCCTLGYSQDIPSLSASIHNHKNVRFALMARDVAEKGIKSLHDETKTQVTAYRDIGNELDKYLRYFELIDVIWQSAKVVVNTVNTLDDIRSTIRKCGELNNTYMEKCLLKGRVALEDTIIIVIYKQMIDGVGNEAQNIYNSYYSIAALYGTTAGGCKTTDLLNMLYSINSSMERMSKIMKNGEYALWRYITTRTTYWKASTYQRVPREQMYQEAIRRWMEASAKPLAGRVKTLTEQRYNETR